MFLPLLQETRKKQEIPGDVFSPAPRNTRELVSLGDCITPAQEIETAREFSGLAIKIKIEKRAQKKGAQMSESALPLFYFRRKM